jgi:hypothetical protein
MLLVPRSTQAYRQFFGGATDTGSEVILYPYFYFFQNNKNLLESPSFLEIIRIPVINYYLT